MAIRTHIVIVSTLLLGAWGPWGKKDQAADDQPAKEERAAPLTQTVDLSGASPQRADINEDGVLDIISWYEGGTRLIRRDVDLNADGTPDMYAFFDTAGYLSQEEMDADFDGKIDWIDHYQGGRRVSAESDTDFDGKMDVFIQYRTGADDPYNPYHIALKERDVDGDGDIDYCTRFPLGKKLVWDGREENVGMLRDINGDRNPDFWEGVRPGDPAGVDHPCALDDGSNMCLSAVDTLTTPSHHP
ncbi:MAG: hypothetical protein JXX28_08975 [Deltaproteobacteria bacterium]|nr:hypothetical protein [Deltaproteobacteria bacterium]